MSIVRRQASTSAPEVWVHVGLPKTGTTTIQLALRDNAAWLADRGWLYPDTGRQGPGHHRLVPALAGPLPDNDWIATDGVDTVLDRLVAEIAAADPTAVVLSSEALGRSPEATGALLRRVGRGLGDGRQTVLLFLRRQDHNLESYYNQTLKTGAVRASDDELRRLRPADLDWLLDYRATVEDFRSQIGDARLLVVPFEERQLQPDLVTVFFDLLGVELGAGFVRPGRTNERLNRHALELLRGAAAERRLIGPRHAALRDRLVEYSKRRGPTPWDHLFSLEMRQAVIDRHRDGNRWIAQHACCPPREELFLEPPPTGPVDPYPGLPADEAGAMLLEVWDWASERIG